MSVLDIHPFFHSHPLLLSFVLPPSSCAQKVLIKEVKQLRGQVDSLTTERNLQINQFRLLREALALGGGALAGSTAAAK